MAYCKEHGPLLARREVVHNENLLLLQGNGLLTIQAPPNRGAFSLH